MPPSSPDAPARPLADASSYSEVLSPEALAFVGALVRRFRPALERLLAARADRQAEIDAGAPLTFLADTEEIRRSAWSVATCPPDLADRRVEITGPVDAKMIINALNSGANVYMADFEDSSAPTWANMMGGQRNLQQAVARTLAWTDDERGKQYQLRADAELATLFVRPRGLHLPERHLEVDGAAAPGSLVDFGLFFFHNARALLGAGTGPYFYLPKLQSHREARWWNEVFTWSQAQLGIPRGSIRATVLIETLPAAFEMHEILWELREHSAGLNCGRWDYIFSFIKTLRARAGATLPDRSQITMTQPNMAAYTNLVIKVCHARGIHAMGGMAAQIPIKRDAAANDAAMAKVEQDKRREVEAGHDGTWVAHPGLIELARRCFDASMPGPNQIGRGRDDVQLDAAALLQVPTGTRSEAGLRHNIRVGVQYLEAWLGGNGCVPLYDLMEDAATAEISRAQVWQWLRHGATLDGGERLTATRVRQVVDQEMATIRGEVGDARFASGRFGLARELFETVACDETLADFLTLPAYAHID
ncbi:MAG: malate synthase A [Deltaproteobacteria bacterium]|nr:malate synthase A [Deltaproteobacteria bacterium]MBP7286245.1 malate synthase A [Nannocystaceae bacterium]